jgi:uncharacterized protein YndB with AHSA1/START domain
MDAVTGARVEIEVTVPIPRERMWGLVTAVDRIGEWSPEAIGAAWDTGGPAPGARFTASNRFSSGLVSTVSCVVTAAEPETIFSWAVLDDAGLVGSAWRYELRDGADRGSTLVRHSFTHGPGNTGPRVAAETDQRALDDRLVSICRNMTTTIRAMVTAETAMGATR